MSTPATTAPGPASPAAAGSATASPSTAKARSGLDRASVEWVKLELMRVAYATRGGFLARRDPRAVIFWYVLCALAPWFTYDTTVLAILFAGALACALAARIGPLLLVLFTVGLVGQGLYLLVIALVLGGDPGAVDGLLQITLKLGTLSLASMAAFVSLDPEKLSDGLLALRAPAVVGFGVSYGYRMVPLLVDEFQTIVDGHRLRGAPHQGHGFLGYRTAARIGTIAVQSFYPLMLNTAKRTRTTVEALETRGFTVTGSASTAGRSLRLAHLRLTWADGALLLVTAVVIVAAYWAGALL
ncbi:energy-coupling factor transporter transmembrane component T [Promicromonospora sukumoe]|uniref:Energy-coupling factor transport system permease protein n=1 Tax=Promicromonospora sukumoe TaxID=88382 RepID=A0A7W3PDV7_9MICO|nr:energy-coupling factor transporter transmembrane component T [Promicromonospora sukumoe]MBA8807899.1 energy-coupling factor transport system permease protein [Promicromonospora sukumoe]